MGLHDTVRVALRVKSEALEPEIDALVESCLQDMRRVGVPEDMLTEETTDPLVTLAVLTWCKGHFGYDNSEASRFLNSYRETLHAILNSPTSYPTYRGGGSACDGRTPSPSCPTS